MRSITILFVCLLVVYLRGAAHAVDIDTSVMRSAPKVWDRVHSWNAQTVAVLPFRVQARNGDELFHVGQINHGLSRRLENAMRATIDLEKPEVVILRDAADAAHRQLGNPSYVTPESRRRLFDVSYPPAWGNNPDQRLRADAFVTGMVAVSDDGLQVTLRIEGFSRVRPESLERIAEMIVPMDRFMAVDLGRGFSASRGDGLGVGMSEKEIVEVYVHGRPSSTDPGSTPVAVSPVSTTIASAQSTWEQFPVELTLFYGGKPQELGTEGSSGVMPFERNTFQLRAEEPASGTLVTVGLRNRTAERIAVVLTINGVNTLLEETGSARNLSRWVLEPEKEYLVKGFYQQDLKTYKPIVGLSDEQSKAAASQFSAEAGLVHLYVFKSQDYPAGGEQTPKLPVTARMDLEKQPTAQAANREQARDGAVKLAKIELPRGLMGPGTASGVEQLTPTTISEVTNIATLIIRYYVPQK